MKRIGFISIALLASTFAACADEETKNTERTDVDTSFLTRCTGEEFQSSPFAGSGYNPEQGLLKAPQDSYIAHTTVIYLRPGQDELFGQLMGPISEQLANQEGLVAISLGAAPECGIARTMAVWENEAAMYDFVASDAHTQAMIKFTEVAQGGAVTHWNITADELPTMSWDTAFAKIAEADPLAY